MKRVLLFLLLTFSFITFSQEKFKAYDLSYFEKTYDISIANSKSISYYIDVPAIENQSVTLIVKEKEVDNFIKTLNYFKSKYGEWVSLANENNITELDKTIDNTIKVESAFLYGRSWNFDFNTIVEARFKIVNGKHLLILQNKHKLKSSSNRYIESKGFLLVFANISEIENFISNFSISDAQDYFDAKNSKEEMFK